MAKIKTPSMDALNASEGALRTATKFLDAMRLQLEDQLNVKKSDEKFYERGIGIIKKILDLSNGIPKTVKTVADLKKEIEKEKADNQIIGGGKKSYMEDPEDLVGLD